MRYPGARIKIEDTIGTLENAIFWCLENLENEDWITLDEPETRFSELHLFGRTPDKWREWQDRCPAGHDATVSATGIFIFSKKIFDDPIIVEFLLKFA